MIAHFSRNLCTLPPCIFTLFTMNTYLTIMLPISGIYFVVMLVILFAFEKSKRHYLKMIKQGKTLDVDSSTVRHFIKHYNFNRLLLCLEQ
jgi:hypothetical protein